MYDLIVAHENGKNGRRLGCLSCGTTEKLGRRRYCSPACRQRLLYKLDMRKGLIQALNIQYATFYFSDVMIMMDLLPYGSREIFSFFYPRSPGLRPADDFCRLADALGNSWWAEKRRTNKRYLAARYVLQQAVRSTTMEVLVKPPAKRVPTISANLLKDLHIDRAQLCAPQIDVIIKQAYRRLVKLHHPDTGGDAKVFRKIHAAYEELTLWSKNPTFISQRGFPDKWFYQGSTNHWAQPIPF